MRLGRRKLSTEFTKKAVDILLLIVGSLLVAGSYAFFMSPYKIIPGGIYGISIVLHHKLGTPIGATALCFNVPLTLIGTKLLGGRFGYKTVIVFIATAVFTDLLGFGFGPDPLRIANDMILAAVFGGALLGLGVGLIFQAKGSSGGSDVIAMIVSKYSRLSLANAVVVVDSTIVIVALIAFRDWRIPLYSWITIFTVGRLVTFVLEGVRGNKAVFIVTGEVEAIRRQIIDEMHRSGTIFAGRGLYRDDPRDVIMTVITQRELPALKEAVHRIDPRAFITIVDASEILGKGFVPLEG